MLVFEVHGDHAVDDETSSGYGTIRDDRTERSAMEIINGRVDEWL